MLICKGENSYKCSKINTETIGKTFCIRFSILEPITSSDIANLFEDDTFYFYDDVLNGRLPDTDSAKLVGLCIIYNTDLTCKIIINLIKRSC